MLCCASPELPEAWNRSLRLPHYTPHFPAISRVSFPGPQRAGAALHNAQQPVWAWSRWQHLGHHLRASPAGRGAGLCIQTAGLGRGMQRKSRPLCLRASFCCTEEPSVPPSLSVSALLPCGESALCLPVCFPRVPRPSSAGAAADAIPPRWAPDGSLPGHQPLAL